MKDKLTSCAGLSPSCVLEIHHSNNFLRKPEYNPPPPEGGYGSLGHTAETRLR